MVFWGLHSLFIYICIFVIWTNLEGWPAYGRDLMNWLKNGVQYSNNASLIWSNKHLIFVPCVSGSPWLTMLISLPEILDYISFLLDVNMLLSGNRQYRQSG
ncbi:hypothetical protein V8F06_000122 [Rhypophila decipiens]